jgi:hypothetical protein
VALSETPDLVSTLAALEQERLAAFAKMKQWALGAAVLTALAAVVFFVLGNTPGWLISLGGGGCIVAVICFYFIGEVKEDFKQKVMPILLQGIDPSLRYAMKQSVSEDDFNRADLFIRPDRFSGKDFVEGAIGETAVRFSLVHAEERYTEVVTDSKGRTHTETRYRTIFAGLFFIADFNKHFAGETKIEPHGANFIDKLSGAHVTLEDPEFNKHFSVSSTDQVEARYILTPSLMERILALHNKVGAFRTAFAQEHVFMAITMPDDAFEPSVRHSLEKSGEAEKILGKLKTITGIVTDLGLNVRIWTKA